MKLKGSESGVTVQCCKKLPETENTWIAKVFPNDCNGNWTSNSIQDQTKQNSKEINCREQFGMG